MVYAYQPQNVVYEILLKNIQLNNINNCLPYKIGIGDLQRSLYFQNLYTQFFNGDIINYGGRGLVTTNNLQHQSNQKVDVITIDSLKLQNLNLIKIDVQGMQAQVINGAINTITKFLPTIIIDYNINVLQILTKLQYICYQIECYNGGQKDCIFIHTDNIQHLTNLNLI